MAPPIAGNPPLSAYQKATAAKERRRRRLARKATDRKSRPTR